MRKRERQNKKRKVEFKLIRRFIIINSINGRSLLIWPAEFPLSYKNVSLVFVFLVCGGK